MTAARGYEKALEDAWTGLMGRDLGLQAANAGGEVMSEGVVMSVLGRRCVITPRERTVTIDGEEASTLVSIVVLHYLANAPRCGPAGKAVSYRQLPGGNVFYGAFKRRVTDVIGAVFDRCPERTLSALEAMGGRRLDGDKFIIQALPRLPVTVILWRGDDELPSSAAVLFDELATTYLHIEDLAEVGTMIADDLGDRVTRQ